MAASVFSVASAVVGVALVLAVLPVGGSAQYAGTLMNYTAQSVDHFDVTNDATYTQRFSLNDTFYQAGGPIFLFLSGEAPMEAFVFQEQQALLWAKEYGALYISLEHRFYGESMPYANYSTESLRVLSAQQALADAAQFITWFNATHQSGTWISLGCSYSGFLSAAFRSKFPDLVAGAVAPSGPVYAVADYSAFNGWFSERAPAACSSAVTSASNSIKAMTMTSDGLAELSKTFQACDPLTADDVPLFFYLLMQGLGEADQWNNPPAPLLDTACDAFGNSTDPVSTWAELYYAGGCTDFSLTNYVKNMQDESNQDRSWWFQKCTAFGFFISSTDSVFSPFDLSYETVQDWCAEFYGIPGLVPDTDWSNAYFGGYDLRGTNIVFTNGLDDPWHLLSISSNTTWGVEAILYDAGHCAPMDAATPTDPPSVVYAREFVGKRIGEWLDDAKH